MPLSPDDLDAIGGHLWETIEEATDSRGGLRYRLRRRPVSRQDYEARIRAHLADRQRTGARVGRRIPAPEPLPEVLAWTATRLDKDPST